MTPTFDISAFRAAAAKGAARHARCLARATHLFLLCDGRRACIVGVPSSCSDAQRWAVEHAYFEARAAVWANIAEGQPEAAWSNRARIRQARRMLPWGSTVAGRMVA